MSTLKQEILEQVQKGENVLQSSDTGASTPNKNEGNVYECRFEAPVYDPATGEGVTALVDDLRKYTRQDASGDTQTYVIKKATAGQELKYNADAGLKIGLVGNLLNVAQFIDTTSQLRDDEDLLKNSDKYFVRNHCAIDATGAKTVLSGTATTAKIFLGNLDDLETRWNEIKAQVFPSASLVADTATAGQLIFELDGAARFFSKKFWGKIEAGDTVPDGSIFYYDGVEAIFHNSGAGHTAIASAKGFYQTVGGPLDVDAEADQDAHTSVFYDRVAYAAAAATNPPTAPTTYVLAAGTGGSAAQFSTSIGHTNLDTAEITHVDKVWTETMAAGLQTPLATDPTATNDYWTLAAAATEPIDDAGAETDASDWALTTAEDLTDTDFWNKLSEGFIEDHDIPVGVIGLVGADNGGEYSPLDANGDPKSSYAGYAPVANATTIRVNQITSTSTAGTATPVVVTTEFKHGLEPGDEVVIAGVVDSAGAAISEVNGNPMTVGRVGGLLGTDLHAFELEGTDLTTLGVGSVTPSTNKGTVTANGIPHLFWGSHTPPTTDQALVYRY